LPRDRQAQLEIEASLDAAAIVLLAVIDGAAETALGAQALRDRGVFARVGHATPGGA